MAQLASAFGLALIPLSRRWFVKRLPVFSRLVAALKPCFPLRVELFLGFPSPLVPDQACQDHLRSFPSAITDRAIPTDALETSAFDLALIPLGRRWFVKRLPIFSRLVAALEPCFPLRVELFLGFPSPLIPEQACQYHLRSFPSANYEQSDSDGCAGNISV